MGRIAGLLRKVREQSPHTVLAIKQEKVDYTEVQAACGHPVLLLRFLKPVFFIPFVELQGSHDISMSKVVEWLAGLHLMPFASVARVRMMQTGCTVDDNARRMMSMYAQQHYKGVQG